MVKGTTLGNWPDHPPKGRDLIDQIRSIAAESGQVFFGPHAQTQLSKRRLTDRDALLGFRIGDIVGDVVPGNNPNEWQCEIVFPSNEDTGRRNIGVITIVQDGERLFIKTVMWKDRR